MQIEFIFDFASPNSYLAHKLLPGISKRTGVEVSYTPVLLGGIFKATGNQPPWQAFSHVPSKVEYEELEFKRFVEKHALVDFQMNPHFPMNTISLMRGAAAAKQKGLDQFIHYVDLIFTAMWERGIDMNNPEEVAKVVLQGGLSAEEFMTEIQSGTIKETLRNNTEDAVARGVFGVPTFFVEKEMFFGKERLGQLEELLLGN